MASAATVHQERWPFQRNEHWFEQTLLNLGENHFKEAFRVAPSTFRYLVESCRPVLERQTTRLKKPISVDKTAIDRVKKEWLQMIRRDQMKDHMREFSSFSGFPQGLEGYPPITE
ncbi:hypothetical protein HPB49_004449 [Dermacentor silvarum]|uniref:Uncharacterized protein n=1 Tax=Dermacentor silvarum TaxID=543639 RepID=A0ACB8D2T7_DERSI|nr:hypothetical protein HPB49_004449 [Dermacentor silvarum]